MTWCNVAIHNAVATSAALGFPIAVANVAGYVVSGLNVQNLPAGSFGYIWLPALAVIAVASRLGYRLFLLELLAVETDRMLRRVLEPVTAFAEEA